MVLLTLAVGLAACAPAGEGAAAPTRSAAPAPTAEPTAAAASSAADAGGAPEEAEATPTPTPTPTPADGAGATEEPAEPAEPACTPGPLAQRAAAVLVVGLPGVTSPDASLAHELPALGVGGVLITKTNVTSAQQVTGLVTALRERSAAPLLVTTDEEFGRVSSFGAVLGRTSSPRTLARRGSPESLQQDARELGGALAAFGVDVVFAPVADLDDGPAQGVIGDRSYSADPEVATAFVRAHADGLAEGGVLPGVKHFPGHGRSRIDSHIEHDVIDTDLDGLRATDLVPFVDQIERGAPLVMLAHVAFPALGDDLPASISPSAYALLRDLGFEGVAITDSLGMGAIHRRWDFPDAAVLAIAAGADAVLATHGSQAVRMRDALVAAVESGALPQERLDEAVARMRHLAGADPADLVCADVPFPPLPGGAARGEAGA